MWLVLILLTAFFTSLIDVISRKILGRVNVYVVAWASPAFSLPFLFPLLGTQKNIVLGPYFFWQLP